MDLLEGKTAHQIGEPLSILAKNVLFRCGRWSFQQGRDGVRVHGVIITENRDRNDLVVIFFVSLRE